MGPGVGAGNFDDSATRLCQGAAPGKAVARRECSPCHCCFTLPDLAMYCDAFLSYAGSFDSREGLVQMAQEML
jgi:hypothetical protein